MKRMLWAGLALFLAPVGGRAAVPDHLKCYKIKDPQARAIYTADLGGLVAEPGCKIQVPALMACVPSTKTNVNPTPPGTGGSGPPNAFGCYKIKCPKATLPAFALNDQFGSRSVTPIAPQLLCAPVPTATTTSLVCCSGGMICGWTTNDTECFRGGGSPGTPGNVCDGATGQCISPPPRPGPCCSTAPIAVLGGTECVSGSGMIISALCTDLGGTLHASGLCPPNGGPCM